MERIDVNQLVAIWSDHNTKLCPIVENKDSFANEICNELSKRICAYAKAPDATMGQKSDIVIIGNVGTGITIFAKNLLRAIAKESHGNLAKVENELFVGKSLEIAEAYSLTIAGWFISFPIPGKSIRLQIARNVKDFASCEEAYNFFKGADHVICLELEAKSMNLKKDVTAFKLSKFTFDKKAPDIKPIDKKTKSNKRIENDYKNGNS
ncbi:hypothetical protein [Sulfurospirillum multivorans]|uniref:Uncharacterized protein n=2 Tax=Sulfurospirillum multivorans TaxID=66821 RepID=A0AA86DYB9_SULMK|nr:hypothetical protein [Sulfurospirillum multivorans]AHJ13023.1 hypothetical protein SMUL_1768 [Sulfurospirillum multivorans DSM 12446]QEH06514.1 hypothetical protein SMN_1749 [Sulfurospirillum multivorans]